jgi:Peptidase A4 family
MTEQETPGRKGLRHYPTPPRDFDPFAATEEDMKRHGLPLRPDPRAKPGLAALWETLWQRQAARYRGFEHLEPRPDTTTAAKKKIPAPALGLDPLFSCGYSLDSPGGQGDPFISLFITWTVPDLYFIPNQFGPFDNFHTFVGLGFLDVHVEMTVDSAQNITTQLWAQSVGNINLPVAPGDVISGALCLETDPPGTAAYFLANETTSQTISFAVDTGFPPAVTINAGVTRTGDPEIPPFDHPLARFGVVYFDEISAYTTSGPRSLTSGDAITMVDENGTTLASPVRLNDYAFKTVFVAA